MYAKKPEIGIAVLVVEVEPGEWVDETNHILKLDSGWADSKGCFVTDAVLCVCGHDQCINIAREREGQHVTVVVDENGSPSYEF